MTRFDRCLGAAAEVREATDGAFLGDDILYRYGSELAMGLALLRARFLDADVRQLAVWDGAPARGAAGTAIDVATWRAGARATSVVPTGRRGAPASSAGAQKDGGRVVRALLFADLKGFSMLRDEQLPRFTREVLGALAEVLRRHEASIAYRNTWGDALYVVLDDVGAAAQLRARAAGRALAHRSGGTRAPAAALAPSRRPRRACVSGP